MQVSTSSAIVPVLPSCHSNVPLARSEPPDSQSARSASRAWSFRARTRSSYVSFARPLWESAGGVFSFTASEARFRLLAPASARLDIFPSPVRTFSEA